VDLDQGSIRLAEYHDSIEQAIRIILETGRGERVMRPDFGCGLHDYVFAPNNATTQGAVADEVREALLKWEPRIDVIDVEAKASGSQQEMLLIEISYRVRSTDTRINMVYPFYLDRGAA
jgi:phage baseplate assembly protein W